MTISKRLFSTTRHLGKQKSIPAAYYRGGTSRALIFHEKDLPSNRDDWKPLFRGVIGSPDHNGRQLDGMGGGISSLSKICVVRRSERKDAEVDFTFVQVGVKDDKVDYAGNCGNMTSAIGPFAVDTGLINVEACLLKLYNTNTDKYIHATFPVEDGEAASSGSFAIDGVSGTAAKIQLDFMDPSGSKTGALLPTGKTVDVFDGVRVSCIDAGNPCVFVKPEDIGIENLSHILPDEIETRHPQLLGRLESIRRQATVKMGMASRLDQVPPSIPKVCIVSQPSSSYRLLSGEVVEADKEETDVVVRAISTGQPHKALPITAGLALSAAARLEGSVVSECLDGEQGGEEIRIGHPSGKLVVGARYSETGELERVTVYRTARRLMEGKVFWK
ncbi:hypothetical protein ASPWEDRAFT_107002 [Aspergillus wentii DTO 134E9]|uniref:PrpF protein n=1 Tax=Aspergillus wentii DTO 134E9 TaxID=1073089 RepID=A0A1L9RQ03_ASPWE|nr:uncharacterized protein ASPWEDRAFT_107002 [Aspergillus wentii DTO 134E9]OJJ36897.1 hypothetical protein ASPWEDRAFT_107002 [Aspergillus wentii DTO 134E9]